MDMVFEPLAVRVTALPELFEMWRDRYPHLSEDVPRPVSLDSGGGPSGVRIELANKPSIPLLRFRDDEQSRWIELQSDRLSCGWSRRSELEYPHYPQLRNEFERLALEFASFVSEENESIQVVQQSLLYVNEFGLADEDPLQALSTSFCYGSRQQDFEQLPPLRDAGLDLRFSFEHEGRRYATLTARSRVKRNHDESESVLRLRFTGDPFRIPDAEELGGFASMLKFFDVGHDAIVRLFTQTTSSQLHERWGRL